MRYNDSINKREDVPKGASFFIARPATPGTTNRVAIPGEERKMQEELNQNTQGIAQESKKPETAPQETPAAPQAEAETVPQSAPQDKGTEPQPASETPKIKVKHNHEERELTLEQARELAEKGLYSEKVIDRMRRMEALAKRAGFDSVEAFSQSWEKQLEDRQKAEFKERTGIDREDIDPVVRQIVDSDPNVVAAREIVRKNQLDAAIQDLREKVPECKYKSAADLTADGKFAEINQLVQAGMTLESAYSAAYAVEIATARAQKVPKPAPSAGSVSSSAAPSGKAYFTREQVLAMSPAEVAKNLDAIEASQKMWK